MLHIQNIQNQCFSSYFLSCFLAFINSDKTFQLIWKTLKYKVKRLHLFPVFLVPLPILFLLPWQLQAADGMPHDRISFRVADQTIDVREHAFQRGLDVMFVRISGDSTVMGKLKRPESRNYVQQFSYEPLKSIVIDSKGEVLTQRIKIRYNTDLVEKYLRENGLAEGLEDSETESIVHIEIAALDSMAKYIRVENYLTQLSAVKTVSPLQTDGGKAIFGVVLRGGEAAFLSKINNDGRLSKVKVEKVAEHTGGVQVNDSKANVMKASGLKLDTLKAGVFKSSNNGEMNPTQSDNAKLNSQPNSQSKISILQAKLLSSRNHQTIPPDTMLSPVPLSDTQANQTAVYHYRFVH